MFLEDKSKLSENPKSKLDEQIEDYILSLHNISDSSKENYSSLLKIFARYLVNRGIRGAAYLV